MPPEHKTDRHAPITGARRTMLMPVLACALCTCAPPPVRPAAVHPDTSPPTDRTIAPVQMSHHVVYRQEGKYASFPSLTIDPRTDHLYTRFSVKDRVSHYETGGRDTRIQMESRDGGVTWQTVKSIPAGARDARPNRPRTGSGNDVLPADAFRSPDGALVRIAHNWRRWFPLDRLPEFKGKYGIVRGTAQHGPGADSFAINTGGYMARSDDDGKTWRRTPIAALDTYSSCSSGWSSAQLDDGTILRAFAVKPSAADAREVWAITTRDGRTAQTVRVMGPAPGTRLDFTEETLVHVTRRGVIWMLTRVHNGSGHWWQAISRDNGRTWTAAETAIDGTSTPPSGLVELSDGRLVLVFGVRRPPFGLRALVSEDEGLTWPAQGHVVLRTDGHGFDLGYPRAARLKDDTIVAVYYYATAAELAANRLTRTIAATRFRLPPLAPRR